MTPEMTSIQPGRVAWNKSETPVGSGEQTVKLPDAKLSVVPSHEMPVSALRGSALVLSRLATEPLPTTYNLASGNSTDRWRLAPGLLASRKSSKLALFRGISNNSAGSMRLFGCPPEKRGGSTGFSGIDPSQGDRSEQSRADRGAGHADEDVQGRCRSRDRSPV